VQGTSLVQAHADQRVAQGMQSKTPAAIDKPDCRVGSKAPHLRFFFADHLRFVVNGNWKADGGRGGEATQVRTRGRGASR
jgi:hypothetical protein